MIFIPINEVKEGMILAKDVRIYNSTTNDVDLLKKGLALTKNYIYRLKNIGSVGLYIYDIYDEINKPIQIIDNALKIEAITGIEKLFESVEKNSNRIDDVLLESVNNLSMKIVDNILQNKKFLVNIIDLQMYDDYTYHHSLSVAVLATSIGLSLNLDDKKLYELSLCSILHDIGKTEIPISLIGKPDKLTDSEFNIIKSHPLKGGRYLIKNNLITENIYNGVVSHHEKYDGSGYPFGLKGDDIPLFGRIISVADVYDALTSNRPYRKPNSPSEAIEYVMGGNAIMFDPNIVSAFLRKIAPYPVNECVRLSNGKIGLVTKVYSENPLRPQLKLLNESHEIYDLFTNPKLINVTITETI